MFLLKLLSFVCYFGVHGQELNEQIMAPKILATHKKEYQNTVYYLYFFERSSFHIINSSSAPFLCFRGAGGRYQFARQAVIIWNDLNVASKMNAIASSSAHQITEMESVTVLQFLNLVETVN